MEAGLADHVWNLVELVSLVVKLLIQPPQRLRNLAQYVNKLTATVSIARGLIPIRVFPSTRKVLTVLYFLTYVTKLVIGSLIAC